MVRTRTKKLRGSRMHRRGVKAGRGKGLKGGSGNAGGHKHHWIRTVKLEHSGTPVFGKPGFTPPEFDWKTVVPINVGDLEKRFPGQASIDLTAAGFTKLLGAGRIAKAVTVKVDAASEGARAKIEQAGGKVETPAE